PNPRSPATRSSVWWIRSLVGSAFTAFFSVTPAIRTPAAASLSSREGRRAARAADSGRRLVGRDDQLPQPVPPVQRPDRHDHRERGGQQVQHGRPDRTGGAGDREVGRPGPSELPLQADRKSTRLNSSHVKISYAV